MNGEDAEALVNVPGAVEIQVAGAWRVGTLRRVHAYGNTLTFDVEVDSELRDRWPFTQVRPRERA